LLKLTDVDPNIACKCSFGKNISQFVILSATKWSEESHCRYDAIILCSGQILRFAQHDTLKPVSLSLLKI